MSKAEELAQWLEARGEENTDAFADHLRTLDASHQRLKAEMGWLRGYLHRYDPPGLPNHLVERIDAALEQAKDLS